uniref:PH domain-containing protein n=1 Tax=Hanusia phi TaxID=3032 RepID=A0A7S0DVW3_9CRYP|mmetsp:Transcript_11326/g.25733  ORF Transcript_11326/g.25733 Transcript_11326/m.25733 type:complete len:1075 (+) Transcript_11326:205-3429(+)
MFTWNGNGREGWINKQAEGMLGKKWQKRWFVLEGISLRYSHTPDSDSRRVFDMDSIVSVLAGPKPTEFQILIADGPCKSFKLAPDSPRHSDSPNSRSTRSMWNGLLDRTLSPPRSRGTGKDATSPEPPDIPDYPPPPSNGHANLKTEASNSKATQRTIHLMCETECDRDAWVQRIRTGMSLRKVTKDAIKVAAEMLESQDNDGEACISIQAIAESLISNDSEGVYEGLKDAKIELQFNDPDILPLLNPLKQNQTIKSLDLRCSIDGVRGGLTDEAATMISSSLKSNTTLTTLLLTNNCISDAGASAIVEAVMHNMTLTELDLDNNYDITEDGVTEIYSKVSMMGHERFQLRLPEKALLQRAITGNVESNLKESEAALLSSVVWPRFNLEDAQLLQNLHESWGQQGLEFVTPDQVMGGAGRFQFGLLQHRSGPCGALAAVQAELLKCIVWPDVQEDENVDCMDWDKLDREVLDDVSTRSLVTAISSILWRARPDKGSRCKVVIVEDHLQDLLDWRSLRVVQCSTYEQLEKLVRSSLDMFVKPGGLVLLVYGAVLTHGLHRVWEETGNKGKAPMSSSCHPQTNGYSLIVLESDAFFCEQSLVNLLLIGHATPDLEPKAKSMIGFLTYTENSKPVSSPANWKDHSVVGTNYKTPKVPIWVVHGGSHYTVLIARSRGLLRLPEPSQKDDQDSVKIRKHRRVPSGGMAGEFVLEHYNGLPPSGPRLSKLYMSFSFDQDGNPIDDLDSRRKWSLDHSSTPEGVPKEIDVPWGQGELFDKHEVKIGSVLVQTSKSGPNGLDLINAGPKMLCAHDTSDMVKILQFMIGNDDTVQSVHWRRNTSSDWRSLGKEISELTENCELLLCCSAVPMCPIPPSLEAVEVKGVFHVTNKREVSDGHSTEFEIALDPQTEGNVLFSAMYYDSKKHQPDIHVSSDKHVIRIAAGMLPQIVSRRVNDDAHYFPLSSVRQSDAEKWRCRACSLRCSQTSLSEQDYFNCLCAVNDPDSVVCKVCQQTLEVCGRCLWLEYGRLPMQIKAHIDSSDRWRPQASQAVPPILHVVRTRWANAALRPGPLWPSKGGPSL